MDFQTAARIQYRHNSIYTVYLVAPDGTREYLGTTQRKSGIGLMAILRRDSVQERMKSLPGADTARFTKHADRLALSNGYRIEFGGTIRQESAE